jgi:hypothetical protein
MNMGNFNKDDKRTFLERAEPVIVPAAEHVQALKVELLVLCSEMH